MKINRSLLLAMTAAALLLPVVAAGADAPRNVILMIGDGMGHEHVKAAGLFIRGREGALAMEGMPHRTSLSLGVTVVSKAKRPLGLRCWKMPRS